MLKNDDLKEIDLLEKMLKLKNKKRIGVEDELENNYIEKYYDNEDENVDEEKLRFEMELDELKKENLKKYIFEEKVLLKKKLEKEKKRM
jgi:mitogen-activated protein kinase 1/3